MTSHSTERANLVSTQTISLSNKIFSDQTGRFPISSSLGNNYVLVMYHHDTNAILTRSLKNKTQDELINNNKNYFNTSPPEATALKHKYWTTNARPNYSSTSNNKTSPSNWYLHIFIGPM